jgi:hypothetical protein
MSHRFLSLLFASVLATVSAAGQIPSVAAKAVKTGKTYAAPRLPDGHPDLQGIWTNVTITPLERPADLAGKAYFTPEEALQYEKKRLDTSNKDRRDGGSDADLGRAYNDAWWDSGTKVVKTLRTSMIIDPPDGKMPPLTTVAAKEQATRGDRNFLQRIPNGPEDLPLQLRCIHWTTAGPPMLPSAYNNNYQIFQVPGYVIISIEMIHDVRVIPMDGRPHLPSDVRQLLGDARGHWEGDTLVIDTTNFTGEYRYRGSDRNLHMIERFTRIDPDTLIYQFTVDDPTVFTKSWTGELPFSKTEGPMYEYACHEGNYSVANTLSGARAQEAAQAPK